MRTTRWVILASLVAMTLAGGAGAESPPKRSPPTAVAVARPAPTRPAAQRRALEVVWGGSFWPAETLERRNEMTKIHYSGWGSEWDEWVEPTRIRPPTHSLGSAHAGQRVEIEWHGSFWPGEVIATRSGFFKVHFAGWGAEWDEWVEIARLHATVTGR
jgi:hypothetical protein